MVSRYYQSLFFEISYRKEWEDRIYDWIKKWLNNRFIHFNKHLSNVSCASIVLGAGITKITVVALKEWASCLRRKSGLIPLPSPGCTYTSVVLGQGNVTVLGAQRRDGAWSGMGGQENRQGWASVCGEIEPEYRRHFEVKARTVVPVLCVMWSIPVLWNEKAV